LKKWVLKMSYPPQGVLTPESVELKHLAGQKQNIAMDKKKLIPILATQLGFKLKRGFYDASTVLGAGDNFPHDICYDKDRDRIWVICNTSPTRILRMNPADFTFDRLTLPVGVNLGYRIAYDGKWIWATTSPGAGGTANVIRVDPDTLAYTVLDLAGYESSDALCVQDPPAGGQQYIWVGACDAGGTICSLLRFRANTFPAYDVVNVLALNASFTEVREIVYDGTRIWICGNTRHIAWVNPDTLAATWAAQLAASMGSALWAGCWDGTYLWWGGNTNGNIAKFNPVTYAVDILHLEADSGILHRMTFDGKYIHAVNYTTGYHYIIHPETMEEVMHETVILGAHAACFDGIYLWICSATASPGTVYRFLVHEPSRRIEMGRTATFAIDAVANKTVAVVFNLPFSRIPVAVVSLNDISDQAAVIVNVDAQTITTTGFNARCSVTTAGAGASTARFGWIASERSTHHP